MNPRHPRALAPPAALALALALATAAPAGAQLNPIARRETAIADTNVTRSLRDPSLRAAIRLPLPDVNLTATTTEKVVKGQLALGGVRGLSGALTLNAPVDQNGSGGRTTVADRDGLSKKASVELALRVHRWKVGFDTLRLNEVCRDAERIARERNLDPADPLLCSTRSPVPAVRQRVRRLVSFGVPWAFAVTGGWGHDSFRWTDPATLAQQSSQHENLKVQGSAGVFVAPVGFLTATYARQRLYQAPPATQLCVPAGGAGALTCSTTAIAAPTAADEDLLSGELRRYFGRGFAAGVAVTRNVTAKQTAVEVPLYFIPDSKGKLNGGIAGQWSTDNRGVRLLAFIGTVFRTNLW
jgi:hypothetical protein